MRKYFLRQQKDSIDAQGNSVNLKPCELPNLGEFMYYFLADQDPDQEVGEEYKKKKDQVFTWRFLRQISFIDMQNYLGRQEKPQDKPHGKS